MAIRLLSAMVAVAVAAVACGASAQSAYPSGPGTVYLSGDAYKFVAGTMDKNGVAWGNFSDQTQHSSAFGVLRVASNNKYNSTTQMYAAGYLEGALTQLRIWQNYVNLYNFTLVQFNYQVLPAQVWTFLEDQNTWIEGQVATNTSSLWQHVANLLAQVHGLTDGYNAVAPASQQLTFLQMVLLNANGDLNDIITAVVPSSRPDWTRMTAEQRDTFIAKSGHCSAIVKVTGNFSDLFASHSTWSEYPGMLRIFKHYEFQVETEGTNNRALSFSSYPGFLSSLDDFYMMHDSHMVMLETTNDVYNMSLYQFVKPQLLSAWHRVRLASTMAANGQQWTQVFGEYNSGTYNNQYMLIDFKLFTAGSGLVANTLWVTEQIPGMTVSADVTQQLERGYWPSYNVPYFPEIYKRSGYPDMLRQFKSAGGVTGLDYQIAPRGEIFRRDQGNVVDMTSLKTLMRSNAYKTDPYSGHSPWHAICSRGDLAGGPPAVSLNGCIDTKVTSASWFTTGKSAAISGPTTGNGDLPPFSFSPNPGVATLGLPETFDFEFEDQLFVSLL